MPGWIDPHVHFRDPGLTHKEDFETGSKAAISGGVTTVFDMPNTIPPTCTIKNLSNKRKLVSKRSYCNYGFFFGGSANNVSDIKQVRNIAGIKLYLNTTTGNLKMDNEKKWKDIFNMGKLVALHAENDTFFRAVDIWRDLGFPCPIHLCHVSLASEIEKIQEIRAKFPRAQITVEVCPHHLFLDASDRIKYGAKCQMKPELASKKDRRALWQAVLDGTIDCFATDHAPHTISEKESGKVFFGVPGIETLFPLIFSKFLQKKWDLKKLAGMTSQNATKIFNIADKKSAIRKNFDADMIVIDPEKKYEIEPKSFFSKSKWSPFAGQKIQGKIEQTYLNGQKVFENGIFISSKNKGSEIHFK